MQSRRWHISSCLGTFPLCVCSRTVLEPWTSAECQLEVSKSHPPLQTSSGETTLQFLMLGNQPQHLLEMGST